MPAPTYIISRVADPIFAVFIGLSAAATRINREEKGKGRTTSQTVDSGLRYVFKVTDHSICHCSLFQLSRSLSDKLRRRLGFSKKAS